jgi:beta-mannosidase
MHNIDLGGAWEFRAVESDGSLPARYAKTGEWMPATVPGTVHTDLMAQGIIPDPYYRTNENDVQWVEDVRWVYRRTFTVPASVLRESTVRLSAEGLDTYAHVSINGKAVGESSNMFIGHSFDVRKVLHAGENCS